MGRRINELFLSNYIELDKLCCEKFGVVSGGVTEYINRLNNARFAPGRDDVLPRLVRYRNIRNKFAHEVGAMRRVEEVSKVDVNWLKTFHRDMLKRRDPISAYLKKARKHARRRKMRKVLWLVTGGVVLALALLIFILAKLNGH